MHGIPTSILLLSLISVGLSDPAIETSGGQIITASETDVIPRFTESLSVSCKFSKPKNLGLGPLMVINLSSKDTHTNDITELVSINQKDPNKVKVHRDVGATVKGKIDQNGESFITMEWKNPNKDVATKYGCYVIVKDKEGFAERSWLYMTVRLATPTIATLVEEVLRLRKGLALAKERQEGQDEIAQVLEHLMSEMLNIKELEGQLEALESTMKENVDQLKADILGVKGQDEKLKKLESSVTQKVDELKSDILSVKDQEEQLKELESTVAQNVKQLKSLKRFNEYGFKSTSFDLRNLMFWSSKNFTLQQAKDTCQEFGGKLVENNLSELNNAGSKLQSNGMTTLTAFWTGVSRDNSTSPWKYMSSGRPSGSVQLNLPAGSRQNCVLYGAGSGFWATHCVTRAPALCSRPL